MNRNKKILNVTMAAGMAAVLGTTPVIAAAQEADNGVSKEETVYVNATAEGEIKDITVSDWLKNSGSAEGDVSDVSDLEGIKNVKGDETFTQDGDKVTWNTDSSDIYYQETCRQGTSGRYEDQIFIWMTRKLLQRSLLARVDIFVWKFLIQTNPKRQ